MLPKIERILYATALGSGAPYVCRYALALAEKHDARITALHVMEPLSPFGQSLVELHLTHEESEKRHAEARAKIRAKTEEKLSQLLEAETGRSGICNSRIESVQIVEGQPDQVILAQAREMDADLIVVGSHRHSAVSETLLGHTANKLSHRADIPLLLVRIPDGY